MGTELPMTEGMQAEGKGPAEDRLGGWVFIWTWSQASSWPVMGNWAGREKPFIADGRGRKQLSSQEAGDA